MNTEYQLSSKKVERNVIQAELSDEELWESDRYQELEQQIEELKEQVGDDFAFAETES